VTASNQLVAVSPLIEMVLLFWDKL